MSTTTRKIDRQAHGAAPAPDFTESVRRLLETAERLFADEGVDSVPLHRIVREAGYRNSSALHYHFGSRAAVVAQVLNMRLAHVNAVRLAHLKRLERAGRLADVHALVEASIAPLATTIRSTDWGARYVQVLAQAVLSPRFVQSELIDRTRLSGVLRVRALLHAALAHLPAAVLDERLVWISDNVVLALARWSRDAATASGALEPPVHELVDYCAAALAAPVTRKTRRRGMRQALPTGVGRYFGESGQNRE